MGRRRILSDAQIAEARRLYEVERWSVDRVGGHFALNGATIWHWLNKAGVKFRKSGWPKGKPNPRFFLPGFGTKKRHLSRTSMVTKANNAAAAFRQESLLKFPPRLQVAFDECVAAVRAERAADWKTINVVTR